VTAVATDAAVRSDLRPASVRDTVRVAGLVFAPMVARGVILRRPWVVSAIEALGLERRGNRLLAQLHDRYGGGPVRLRLPGRRVVLVLSPSDVRRVLDETPEPFAPDSR
jgi:hypothetical protein